MPGAFAAGEDVAGWEGCVRAQEHGFAGCLGSAAVRGRPVGHGFSNFCLSVHVGLATDDRFKTFCHYIRPVFRAFQMIPLPHIQGFVQTR